MDSIRVLNSFKPAIFSYALCCIFRFLELGHKTFVEIRKLFVDFLRNYPDFSFEILDELYGCNMVSFTGYLSLAGMEKLIEACFSICYTGSIVYRLRE